MKKQYEKPEFITFDIDLDLCLMMTSGDPTNGSGKTPPGWKNPNNPHNPGNGKGKNAFEDNPFGTTLFENE